MGWSQFSDIVQKQFFKNQINIMMYSNTSYIDLYIMILYYMSYHRKHNTIKLLLVDNQSNLQSNQSEQSLSKFNYQYIFLNWILNNIGVDTYLSLSDKIDNILIEQLIDNLKNQEKTILLIPFSYYIENTEIYDILKNNITFSSMSIGLDYEKKIVKLSPEIPSIIENDFVNKFLQHYISNIVPINPSNVKFKIRQHNKSQLTIFNFKRLKILIIIVSVLNIFFSLNLLNFIKLY
jgi:hypothetical protein